MNYIYEGEVVDTYGGDFTYRDVWYEVEDGKYYFYERFYGAKPSDGDELIEDKEEIKEFMNSINEE